MIEEYSKNLSVKQIINLIITYINKNECKESLEKITKFLMDKITDKNKEIIYIFDNNEKIMASTYILRNIYYIDFREYFINKLKDDYLINEDTVFKSIKDSKFNLLEEMIRNGLFLYEYKKKTMEKIEQIINESYKFKYNYEKLVIVFDNYRKNIEGKNYYHTIEFIIKDNEQIKNLKSLYENIEYMKKKVDLFEKIECFLDKCFKKSKKEESNKIKKKLKI